MPDDVAAAFEAALAKDAKAAPPSVPAPPRKAPVDIDAPHGRDMDGKPLAPHGVKSDGKPRIKPGGPGRGHTGEKPRVEPKGKPGEARDYTADLAGLGQSLWMCMAALPPTKPAAFVVHEQIGPMAAAWNVAAQKNADVRKYVDKLAGDGSWGWVLGVAISTAPVAIGIWQLTRPVADKAAAAERDAVKEQLAAKTDEQLHAFMAEMTGQAALHDLALEKEFAAAQNGR